MAESYERLGRLHDAIRCFLRADSSSDREGLALFKLAKLHAQLAAGDASLTLQGRRSGDGGGGNNEAGDDADHNQLKAANYFRRLLVRENNASSIGLSMPAEIIEARLFVAEFCKLQVQRSRLVNFNITGDARVSADILEQSLLQEAIMHVTRVVDGVTAGPVGVTRETGRALLMELRQILQPQR